MVFGFAQRLVLGQRPIEVQRPAHRQGRLRRTAEDRRSFQPVGLTGHDPNRLDPFQQRLHRQSGNALGGHVAKDARLANCFAASKRCSASCEWPARRASQASIISDQAAVALLLASLSESVCRLTQTMSRCSTEAKRCGTRLRI
jgi:hypothetical protein